MALCGWEVDRSCLPSVDEDSPDAIKQQHAEQLAVDVLWALSGRQFGVCPVIARPCPQTCSLSIYTPYIPFDGLVDSYYPVYYDQGWRNTSCGCAGRCSYRSPSIVHLGGSSPLPVQSVVEVVIAGEVLSTSQYRLEGDLLYRVGGVAWPSQNLGRPLDEEGTWSVEYLRGNPPPPGTAVLVGVLAKEFLNACNGGKCRLPRRVRPVSRSGASFESIDPIDILASGKTGLTEVDLWLAAVNPRAMQSPPKVR